MSGPLLVLMARQPLPGRVKTRLQADSDGATAAAVAAELIRGSAALARRGWDGPVELHAWPDGDHPLLAEIAREHGLVLRPQARGDLGAKMHAALARGIETRGACAVMGCDVPHCPPPALRRARGLLAEGRAVLGPASDGGFWLLGLTHAEPTLFEQVAWGSSDVRARVLANAARAGVAVDATLPCLRDIDTWPDLVAAASACAPLRRFLAQC